MITPMVTKNETFFQNFAKSLSQQNCAIPLCTQFNFYHNPLNSMNKFSVQKFEAGGATDPSPECTKQHPQRSAEIFV